VDSRIATRINVKYNKPDIFIYDKVKNEIVIVEVGITSFDNLRAVETEKRNKYDYLANHCAAMYKAVNTRIIPYVMTWEGLVTTFHEEYCKELRIDRRTEAYVQPGAQDDTREYLDGVSKRTTTDGESRDHRPCTGGHA